MRPDAYYTLMRQTQDPRILRLQIVLYAKEHGVKPAAERFNTTPKTVRKWLSRFDGKLHSLQEQSRAPIHRPRKLPHASEQKILRTKQLAPRFSAKRLKLEFELPWSVKANHYLWFLNIARRNSARENKTPWELINQKLPSTDPMLPLLSVEYLEELYEKQLHSSAAGGYDFWALP